MKRRGRRDGIRLAAGMLGALTVLACLALAAFLVAGSLPVLRAEGLGFVTGDFWAYRERIFGAAAMVFGSAAVAAIALGLAAPVGLAAALFSAEVCPPRARLAVKALIELLAGVPSVVYGLLGVLYLRRWIGALLERLPTDAVSGDTLLTAGVLLAVMILPTVTTLADDAFRAVPARAREAARGLGLTRAETVRAVVLPQAAPALVAALLLALGRALGETIAVFLVVGRADNRFPAALDAWRALLEPGQTITSKLGGAEVPIALGDPTHTAALLGLALLLLASVLAMTVAAERLRRRVAREVAP